MQSTLSSSHYLISFIWKRNVFLDNLLGPSHWFMNARWRTSWIFSWPPSIISHSHIYFKKYKTNCPNGANHHLDVSPRKYFPWFLSNPYRKLAFHCLKVLCSVFFIILCFWCNILPSADSLSMFPQKTGISPQEFSVAKDRAEEIVPVSEKLWKFTCQSYPKAH